MQYGHFDNEAREYVIDRVDLPASWTNYIGTKDMLRRRTCVRKAAVDISCRIARK